MSVQARMFVQSIERHAYNRDALTVTLSAVSRGEENKIWASATPSANLKMVILNGPATKIFEEAFNAGTDIAVTFDHAPTSE